MKITVKQKVALPSTSQLDKAGHLVLLLPPDPPDSLWSELPYGDALQARFRRLGKSGDGPWFSELPNRSGTRVVWTTARADASPFERLTRARRLAALLMPESPREVLVVTAGLGTEQARAAGGAVCAALLAAAHDMPAQKSTRKAASGLQTVRLFGLGEKVDAARLLAEAEGNNLARYLTALPPNQLTPGQYLGWLKLLARQHGWRLRFHDTAALQRKKAGAFLAVAQGSPEPDAGIAHLRYTPEKGTRKAPLALVGKGICFDTGGNNLKSARHMLGMHTDMAGSAVALGTLLALTELKVPYPVDCWLALAQNHIGPKAYKQNDVVTAADGTTIEVVHTDAEGRMVLADALVLACREKPGMVIDYATLTGSCVEALGSSYAGAFSNRDDWHPAIIAAGRESGERVWPFPNDPDYDQRLESDVADVRQCAIDNEADHILAGRFLQRFVGKTPWLHLDLAAAHRKGGLAHVPTDATGFGVRFSLSLLLDRGLWNGEPPPN